MSNIIISTTTITTSITLIVIVIIVDFVILLLVTITIGRRSLPRGVIRLPHGLGLADCDCKRDRRRGASSLYDSNV